jgi:hypothetical protein
VYGANCVCAGTLPAGVRVSAQVFLEGCYDAGSGSMYDSLRTRGVLPLTEPYTALGFALTGGGGETTTAPVLATTGATAIVDWVLLELRSAPNSATVVRSVCALLRRDGSVVATDGTSPALFPGVSAGTYFLSVRHRNHLGVMTSQALALSPITTTVAFSSPATGTFGTQATKSVGAVNVLWAGNVFVDQRVSYTGANNDRDPILVRVGGITPNNVVQGYYAEDVNMDGSVKYTGAQNDRDPILVNIGSTTPTNVRLEQLP